MFTRTPGLSAPDEIDYEHLANLVRRRCVGCAPDYHLAIAHRFLSQSGFDDEDIQQVLDILQRKLRRKAIAAEPLSTCSMNGSVVCDRCRQRMADHPRDPENPEQVVACNGRRVRLCL